MYTLKNSTTTNNTFHLINEHIELFCSFENIYLFGSILDTETPNDIDILLIYSQYSHDIINDLEVIYSILDNLSELPIDFTVLSVEEEKETKFLKRLHSRYLKLK